MKTSQNVLKWISSWISQFKKKPFPTTLKNYRWNEIQGLVCDYYRNQGFSITPFATSRVEHAIDFVATTQNQKILIQCKHWKKSQVRVPVVREMYGLMLHHKADSVALVTSGQFTRESREFAEGKPIKLIEAAELLSLAEKPQAQINSNPSATTCPACNGPMVLRTAKKGPSTGAQFWGCSNYPQCKGTRPYSGGIE